MNNTHDVWLAWGSRPRLLSIAAALGLATALLTNTISLAAVSASSTPTPGAEMVPDLNDVAGLTAFMDGALAASMEQNKVPSGVVAVVKDGQPLFAKGYGYADIASGRKADANSVFRVGSIAKLFIWTSVMQLVERGKLDLNADVNQYLDRFKIPATYPQPITLLHLMTHTAGFEEGFAGYVIVTDPAAARLPIADAVAAHIPARVRPPGVLTSYSNYGAALAALIVERVSGTPFDDYVRRNIFEPLGMRHSTFGDPLPEALLPWQVTGYLRENGDYVAKPFARLGGFHPVGGLSSTAEDMARFMIACLQDGRYQQAQILTPESARQMRAVHVQLDPRLPGIPLGLFKWRKNGFDMFGHGGDLVLFRSYLSFIPDQRVGIFMSFVGPGGAPTREALVTKFFDRYFPASTGAVTPVSATRSVTAAPGNVAGEVAASPQAVQQQASGRQADKRQTSHQQEGYAGTYQWSRRNQSKIDKVFDLGMQIDVSELPNGHVVVSSTDLGEPYQFRPLGDDLFQQIDSPAQMVFHRNGYGVPTQMLFDFAPYMPVERAPWHEKAGLWFSVLGLSALLFLFTLASYGFRRREIGVLPQAQKRTLRLSCVTSAMAFISVLAPGITFIANAETFVNNIPTSFKMALALPLVFVALTLALLYATVNAWRQRWWGLGRRVSLTSVALAATGLSLFFWKWNLLGWQFG